jgi:hypothetical protein
MFRSLPCRHSTFQDRRQLSNRFLFFRREILLTRLGVDHQQIERAGGAVVKVNYPLKVNYPRAAALAAAGPRPSDLPHTASFGDQVPRFGIPRDEINRSLPLGVVPDFPGLPIE